MLLNQKDIATMVGRSCRTLRRWVKRGVLPKPVQKLGKRSYWTKKQIDTWLKNTEGQA